MVLKKLNIKGENDYTFKDLVNLKYLDLSLITLDKRESVNVDIYYVNYAKRHPFRLYIKELDGYFSEEKRNACSNKYMHIVVNDNNEDYAKIWEDIKNKIEIDSFSFKGDYGNNFMKVVVNSDNDLPVDKVTKFRTLVLSINYVFKKGNKYLPQIFLIDCFYDNM